VLLASAKLFYATMAAGAVFIVIGIASSIYSYVPVDVPLDGTLKPGFTDELSPEMNVGGTASIQIVGSVFDVVIEDPTKQVITSQKDQTNFTYELTASKEGEYRIIVTNTGTEDLAITGHAQTKGSPLAFSGPMLLVITGVIVIGLGLRFRPK
jgi:hypothetical protein